MEPVSKAINIMIALLSKKEKVSLRKRLSVTTPLNLNECEVHIVCNSVYELEKRSQLVENETLNWLKDYVHDGESLIDVGASVGTYGLIAAKLYPNLTAYCIEPSFTNFNSLCQNILLNSLQGRVFPFCGAISEKQALSMLLMPHTTTGAAGHQLANGGTSLEKSASFSSIISVYTIDDFVSALGITTNHIKVDVDGLDFEVIKGADKTLRNNALKSLCIEVDANTITTMTQYLSKYGYKVVDNPQRTGTTWNITLIRK